MVLHLRITMLPVQAMEHPAIIMLLPATVILLPVQAIMRLVQAIMRQAQAMLLKALLEEIMDTISISLLQAITHQVQAIPALVWQAQAQTMELQPRTKEAIIMATTIMAGITATAKAVR